MPLEAWIESTWSTSQQDAMCMTDCILYTEYWILYLNVRWNKYLLSRKLSYDKQTCPQLHRAAWGFSIPIQRKKGLFNWVYNGTALETDSKDSLAGEHCKLVTFAVLM